MPLRVSRPVRRATAILAALTAACTTSEPATEPGPGGGAGEAELVSAIAAAARPLTGASADYDPLLAAAASARVVLLGESTHGTHEFYRERARITQRLVLEQGVTAIAIEGDWAETYRINEYVRGAGAAAGAERALATYHRFPRWMWANVEFLDLVRWVRGQNDARSDDADIGVYGLDIQSFEPVEELPRLLAAVDPSLAAAAQPALACLRPYVADPDAYGAAAARSAGPRCRQQVGALEAEVRRVAEARAPGDLAAREALFGALGAVRALAAAEEYFRVAATGTTSTWNLRDRRMAEALEFIEAHAAARTGQPGRVVVWAHNTHVGDARQSETGEEGELNIGQLARERLGDRSFSVGFLTYEGAVLAAADWGLPGREVALRPALAGSFPALLHEAGAGGARDFLLLLRGDAAASAILAAPRLDRAVGVVYRPDTERQSHYLTVRLGRRYDAVVFVDRSRAVRPLTR